MGFKNTFKLLAINLGLVGTTISRRLSILFKRISRFEKNLIRAGDNMFMEIERRKEEGA